jgi:hypothetical protein
MCQLALHLKDSGFRVGKVFEASDDRQAVLTERPGCTERKKQGQQD